MFQAKRPIEAPECSKALGYNNLATMAALHKIFHGKCYLCEQSNLNDPEIEHLEPHMGNEDKKFSWENLYYSCSRCNSIKGTKHTDILDCCNEDIDVFKAIKCVATAIGDHDIIVEPANGHDDERTLNTVDLISRCYNDRTTATRGVTRAELAAKIHEELVYYLNLRLGILNKRSTPEEIESSTQKMKVMFSEKYPFSAIWKWHVIEDSLLYDQVKDHIDF